MNRSTVRRRSVLALIAAAALAVAGCSGSDDGGSGEASGSVADAGQSSAAGDSGGTDAGASDGGAAGTGSADASGSGDAGGSGGQAAASGEFTLGVPSYFTNHFMPGSSGSSNVSYALFTPLTEYDPATGELVNAVAEEISSDDQKVWDITLKDGWTFHNGEPVTAQSFADSWNATANPKNAMTNLLQMSVIEGYEAMNPAEGEPTATELSGVEVVDEHTLKVTLTGPNALFPYRLSSGAFAPIPKEASKDFAAFDKNPIGNGPFMITGGGMQEGDQQVVLKAYPDYAGADTAKTETITVRSYVDASAIYTDFQAGAIDLMLADGQDLAAAQAEYPDQVVPVQFPAVVYLGFPTWDDRLSDLKMRQAFSLAVDRQSIVDALLGGNATVAQGVAPETMIGGGQSSCEVCTFDVDKAKSLLAEAGGFDGELTLYTYTDPTMEEVVNAVANQLRTNLGINATAQTLPVSQLYDNFDEQSLKGLFVLYSGSVNPHLYGEVHSLFTLGSALNAADYQSDDVEKLIADAMGSGSDEEFTAGIQEAAKTALADLPLAPLYYPKGGLLHTPNLSNVTPELLGSADLSKISVTG